MIRKALKNILQFLLDKWIYRKYAKHIVIGKRNYQWCTLPVPMNYPRQSQTHPSILYFKDGWQGATHWIATTPYPDNLVEYENPCIYYANVKSPTEYPSVFIPIQNNPILLCLGGNKFNSDVELYFENDVLYSIIREYDSRTLQKKIKVQTSKDGRTWTLPRTIFSTDDESQELLSPSVIKYKNTIRLYCLNGNAGIYKKGICTGIDILDGISLTESNFFQTGRGTFQNKETAGIEPWHCDVFEYGEKLYMVLCARDIKKKTFRSPMETYLAVSANYQDFYIFPKPLIRHIKTYRPSAYVSNNNLYLYFSSVGRYLNDNSDRNIGVASFQMEELLNELQTPK